MEFIKKQGIGTWVSLISVVLAVVAMIVYGVATNVGADLLIANGSEFFYESKGNATMNASVVTCGVLALVLLVGAIVASQFKFDGVVAKVVDIVVGVARILFPIFITIALLAFLSGSFTGLGWTFFSNAELDINPDAVTTGKTAIAGLIIFGVAMVAGLVAPFFAVVKED